MAENITMRSTNGIEITGLRSRATGAYVQDATLDADLLDAAGAPVSGGQNLVLTLVPETANRGAKTMYRGILPSTVVLTEGAAYTVRTTATQDGQVREFNIAAIAILG
jgi:hypothetical protein